MSSEERRRKLAEKMQRDHVAQTQELKETEAELQRQRVTAE